MRDTVNVNSIEDEPLKTNSLEWLILALVDNSVAKIVAYLEDPTDESSEECEEEEAGEEHAADEEEGSLSEHVLHILRCRDITRLFAAMAFNRGLLSLKLQDVPEDIALVIAEALKHNITLQSLSVSVCTLSISDETGRSLARSLEAHPALHSFTLDASAKGQGQQTGPETGLALAHALHARPTLQAFALDAGGSRMGQETGLALARALQAHPTLQAFALNARGTSMGQETGLALALALHLHPTLQSFALNASGTSMGQETGLALARALKSHRTLKTFEFCAKHTSVGAETGRAMADAVKRHCSLESFTFLALRTGVGEETVAAMADALPHSIMPLFCRVLHGNYMHIEEELFQEHTARNRELRAQRHALTGLARGSADGFLSLAEIEFRKQVLRFFLPPGCRLLPIEFARGVEAPAEEGAAAVAAAALQGVALGEAAAAAAGSARATTASKDAEQAAAAAGVAPGGAPPEDAEEEQLGQALAASIVEANEEENSALAAAILRSKADAPVASNFDADITLLRITRYAKTDKVYNAILDSRELAACCALVTDAGCELHPEWAGGAWLLLPFTQQQYVEAALELGPEHILVRSQDVPAVREAMKASAAKRGLRPKVKQEAFAGGELVGASQRAEGGSSASSGPSQIESADMAGVGVELVVERTFYHFPLPRMDLRTSVSAPL